MSEKHNLKDDFKVITYKRKSNKIKKLASVTNTNSDGLDIDVAFRRIREAKNDISSSDLHASVVASLREGLATLSNPKIEEIVCFGLGQIAQCTTSRYQLALLLCIKDLHDAKVYVYDPIFTETERDILKRFECDVLTQNTEGKHPVVCTTLFYLPHCPKQLSNNLLWANWGLRLSDCIIVANSFTTIVERHTKKTLNENAEYIFHISPYVIEFAVINTFRYYDVFNDTTVHVFPLNKLQLLSEDFWKYSCEPKYGNDVEFITN